jgi:hypothetical protein
MKAVAGIIPVIHLFLMAGLKAFVPIEYEFPKAILSSPKTYVYKNLVTSQFNYKDVSRRDQQGQVTIIWKDYGGDIIDSCVEVNDKALDHYMILNGYYFKGVRTQDSTYADGTRLGLKKQSECFTINASMEICGDVSSHFLKDTVVKWNNKKIETLVIESVAQLRIRNPKDVMQRKESVATTFYYFGKDVGLLRYSTTSEGKTETFELHEIKEQSSSNN